jgi:DNA replication and repair protein RecF
LTDQLIDNAVKIYIYRQKFIGDINAMIASVNDKIKGFHDMQIEYETSIPITNTIDIKNNLLVKYKSNLQREIFMSQTMIGPHRDDFAFFTNGKNIKEYGSQGQQRMAVLCLKLAEIEIFRAKKDEYPVLLLDDIFSELDSSKRHNIIKYLNKKMQILITTTDISDIEKAILTKASIFVVDKAVIRESK